MSSRPNFNPFLNWLGSGRSAAGKRTTPDPFADHQLSPIPAPRQVSPQYQSVNLLVSGSNRQADALKLEYEAFGQSGIVTEICSSTGFMQQSQRDQAQMVFRANVPPPGFVPNGSQQPMRQPTAIFSTDSWRNPFEIPSSGYISPYSRPAAVGGSATNTYPTPYTGVFPVTEVRPGQSLLNAGFALSRPSVPSSGGLHNQIQNIPQPPVISTHTYGAPGSGAPPVLSRISTSSAPAELYNLTRSQYEQIETLGFETRTRREHSNNSGPSTALPHTTNDDNGCMKAPLPVHMETTSGESQNEMALEMKKIVERLREWRAKDPELFERLWNDMRQAQKPGNNASAQPLSLRPTRRTPDAVPSINATSGTTAIRSVDPAMSMQSQIANGLEGKSSFPPLAPPIQNMNLSKHTDLSTTPGVNEPQIQTKNNAVTTAHGKATYLVSPRSLPLHKQQALAQAASEYLMTCVTNRNRPDIFHLMVGLLTRNLNYVDLCHQLESHGFVLDRARFAKHLLMSVPDIKGITLQAPQNKPDASLIDKLGVCPPPPSSTFRSTLHLPSGPRPPHTPAESLPNTSLLFPAGYTPMPQIPSTRHPGQPKGIPLSQPLASELSHSHPTLVPSFSNLNQVKVSGPGEPGTKKRLFSEIVDLTKSSDEDPESIPLNVRLHNVASGSQDTSNALAAGSQITPAVQPPPFFQLASPAVRDTLRKQKDIAMPLNPDKAAQRTRYNKETIARDVLVATGRHPTERPLNQHLMGLLATFSGVSHKSDLETFRWDLVDPGGPPRPVVEPEPILISMPGIPKANQPSRDISQTPNPSNNNSDLLPASSAGQPQQQASKPIQAHPLGCPTHDESNQAITTAATTTTGEMDSPIRQRPSRPLGVKSKLPTKASLKAATSSASKVEVAIPVKRGPDPQYSIYHCEWEDCGSELHDLKTLERHVAKSHTRDHQKFCRWARCPNSRIDFASDDLRAHIQKSHIDPVAWKLGDGPSVNRSVLDSGRYLMDHSGSLITPAAATTGDFDSLIFPVGRAPVRAFNKIHGNQSMHDKAREVFKAIQHQRRKVGFGLEQEGCELATPKRNYSISNDEEVYALIPADI